MSSSETATLEVLPPHEFVEVTITDDRMRPVGTPSSLGRCSVEVAPGMYQVDFRIGPDVETKYVRVPASGQRVRVRMRPEELQFDSSAPTAVSRTRHEHHMGPARDLSRPDAVMKRLGEGSALFLFVRDVVGQGRGPLGRGLELRSLDGEVLATVRDDGLEVRNDGFAALHVAVDPGSYRLRLKLAGDRGYIEQTIHASRRWQTQVFLQPRVYSTGIRQADLRTMTVLTARATRGFEPDAQALQRTDAALAALASVQTLARRERGRLLRGKFDNPMEGILGAHLHLMTEKLRPALMREVIGNLRRLAGAGHPDVVAIRCAVRNAGGTDPVREPPVVQVPPMLHRSWRAVVVASQEQPELVPLGSLADRISAHAWGSEGFLRWRREDSRPSVPLPDEVTFEHLGDRLRAEPLELRGLTGVRQRLAQVAAPAAARWFELGGTKKRGATHKAEAWRRRALPLPDRLASASLQLGMPKSALLREAQAWLQSLAATPTAIDDPPPPKSTKKKSTKKKSTKKKSTKKKSTKKKSTKKKATKKSR